MDHERESAQSKRGETLDERITAATLELLRTRGPKAVTIEAVAARTGMARTTIYRRYRDRNEMLAAAMEPIAESSSPAPPSTDAQALAWLVEQSLRSVDDGIGFGGLAALVTDADPASTDLIRSILARHRAALGRAVEHDIEIGHGRRDLDVDTFLDCIIGAYFAEHARSGAVEPGWADRVVRTLLPSFARSDRPAD